MAEAAPAAPWTGVRVGPFQIGERITLTDPKGRRHSVVLAPGGAFHTTKGSVSHDELIDGPEGVVSEVDFVRRWWSSLEVRAMWAASTRVVTPSLCRMLETWALAVSC